LWLTYFVEYASGKDFSILGILPRTISGLPGIVFTPFLHGSFSHLISNSVPLLVLGFGLIYFYRNIAYKIFLLIWVIDGLGVWLLGREAYHIGASGLVYGMTSFLIFSGVLRKNRHLLALGMVIIFVYGSLVWGMFPYIPDVSWEAHLFGFLAGVYFSVHYLLDGPPNDPVPEWMNEDEEEMAENDENNAIDVQQNEEKFSQQKDINVQYTYIPTKTNQ
jgi:membrane associated rhomboid family serine protease